MLVLFISSIINLSLKLPDNSRFYDQYTPLESHNNIPADFLGSFYQKYLDQTSHVSNIDNRFKKKTEKKFLLTSNILIDNFFKSGRILFGDSVTNYINEVASKILEKDPELKKQLRFYTLKSSTPNAYSLHQGIILVTVGLIANLETESELAFILEHEISHFIKGHVLKGYHHNARISKKKGSYKDMTYEERFELVNRYSRTYEYEADSLAIVRIINDGYYTPLCAERTLEMLHYSYLPFHDSKLDKTFFNSKNFSIPMSFFKPKVDDIKILEDRKDIDDKYYTHPDIKKRINRVQHINQSYIDTCSVNFRCSKTEFHKIRELARFESIRLDLLRRNYGDAIYNSYTLLQTYPNNVYLKMSIAKALYGLVKYKNAGNYSSAARSYTDTEGFNQQLHYMLKQFTKIQLNTFAIKYIRNLEKKYPEKSLLKILEEDLIRDMVVVNETKLDHFYTKIPTNSLVNNEAYLEYIETKDIKKLRQSQRESKNFYKIAFVEDMKDEAFVNSFEKYYKDLEEKIEFENLDYKKQEKIKKKKEDLLQKNGDKIFAKKIIVIDPVFFNVTSPSKSNRTQEKNTIKNQDYSMKFVKAIEEISKDVGIEVNMICSSNLKENQVQKYNQLSRLKEWLQELFIHKFKRTIPLFTNQVSHLEESFGSNLVCYSGVYNENNDNQYYFVIIDIHNGEILYKHIVNRKSHIGLQDAKRHLETDLNHIIK